MTQADISALILTFKTAALATFFLLLLGTPLAWWLSRYEGKLKTIISALVALPLVLPPTVLGFYLLILLGKNGIIGQLTTQLGWGTLPFTFAGLVVASVLYSLPFVVQPLQVGFAGISKQALEAAATLGASPIDAFFSVALPLTRSSFITAGVLGFTHTVGEFGVVLMVGGNIPDKTRVVSVQIYNHVEALDYSQAHSLAAILVVFSFTALWLLYHFVKTQPSARR
jgi:molybdate transport system permease protein